MRERRYSERIELMFDVMLCLPRSAWKCVLGEVDKKIGTAALRKIILHACNESDTHMLERIKRDLRAQQFPKSFPPEKELEKVKTRITKELSRISIAKTSVSLSK